MAEIHIVGIATILGMVERSANRIACEIAQTGPHRHARGPDEARRREWRCGLVWFCGPGVLRVVGCYWWCCAHWRAYWLGESQLSALSRLSVLDGDSEVVTDG